MKKCKQLIQLLLLAGLLFTVSTACDKTDDPVGDFPSEGIVKDADGNKYNTVKIGTQIWTVENLKTTKYNDGTQIPNVKDNDEWKSLTTGAYCNFENSKSNIDTYGRLYNWYAVNTGKLAPTGWHVPTDEDWTILENYLIENGYNYDGTTEENKIAKSLCVKTNWLESDEDGTPGIEPESNNSSGFSAIACYYRITNGEFFLPFGQMNHPPTGCIWWSSTKGDDDNVFARQLVFNSEGMSRDLGPKGFGFSVRLVKD